MIMMCHLLNHKINDFRVKRQTKTYFLKASDNLWMKSHILWRLMKIQWTHMEYEP